MLVQMQWQLIPETTMHAFDINALLTMIAINKLMDRTRADPKIFRKWPETDTIFYFQCKNGQCSSKNTHAAVPEKLTINFFLALKGIYICWYDIIFDYFYKVTNMLFELYYLTVIFLIEPLDLGIVMYFF